MKILVIGGSPKSLVNFRGDLIRAFVEQGHSVLGVAQDAPKSMVSDIEALGCRFKSIPIERNGLNPFSDLKVLWSLYKLFKLEEPDIVLSYTIKPVIWGGVAAKFRKNTRFYGLITGLGFAFQSGGIKRNLLSWIATSLYQFSLKTASAVIFQNLDNRQVFIDKKIIPLSKTHRVNGSGVNVSRFKSNPLPEGGVVFLSVSRLLGEKGLREYVEAAKIVKKKYPNVTIQLLGAEDPSPDGISRDEVRGWHDSGAVEYLGSTMDVRPFLKNCTVFVLASYHEGMPRTVLEAMSVGRPILTTDTEGCRETVVNGKNGFLVPVKSVDAIVEKMYWFIENSDKLAAMGAESRLMAEELFDVHKVNNSLLSILELKRS